MELFLDNYGTYSTRNRSTTGVYISFSNIRLKHKFARQHVHTITLVPPGVPLKQALKPLFHELRVLARDGFEVQYREGEEVRTVRVKGAISGLPSDHFQACMNSNHLGSNAQRNCRMCMVTKNERTEYDTKILNWEYTRNNEHTTALLTQMIQQLGVNPSEEKKKEVRKFYGLYEAPSIFSELSDPFTLSIPCVGHCIELGILMRLLDAMLTQVRNSTQLSSIFDGRLFSFSYPRQWTAVKINLLTVRSKRQRPMHFIRKFALMSPLLFDGLVDPQLLKLVRSLLRLRSMIMNPSHSVGSIQTTQQTGRLWVALANAYTTLHSKVKLDVPNFHLLIEIMIRSLPVVRDMRIGMTTRFEAEHLLNKQLVKRVTLNRGAVPENFALQM